MSGARSRSHAALAATRSSMPVPELRKGYSSDAGQRARSVDWGDDDESDSRNDLRGKLGTKRPASASAPGNAKKDIRGKNKDVNWK